MKGRRPPGDPDNHVRRPSSGKTRVLTSAELALWRAVTAHVTPHQNPISRKVSHTLQQDPASVSNNTDPVAPDETSATQAALDRRSASPPVSKMVPPKQSIKPLMTIDPRMKRELTKGRLPIDARLDLHGCRASEAHQRLVDFLISAQRNGARMVLIVTGKGGRLKTENHAFDGSEAVTGILRRQAPLWLADPRLRSVVGGFSESAQTHGGAGALYVRIRRR